MRNWHETERHKAAERRAKAAAAPSTVGISKRPGGGGNRGGSVLPKRLKSGSGHHRLDICGPSNGRHMIAQDCSIFFAMLHSLPSTIDDALDTLCEPNAVFSQFLGSASMNFSSFPFLASSCLFFPFSFFALSFLGFFFYNRLASVVRMRSDRYHVQCIRDSLSWVASGTVGFPGASS